MVRTTMHPAALGNGRKRKAEPACTIPEASINSLHEQCETKEYRE